MSVKIEQPEMTTLRIAIDVMFDYASRQDVCVLYAKRVSEEALKLYDYLKWLQQKGKEPGNDIS